jgi:large subunit ribosomal protein L25
MPVTIDCQPRPEGSKPRALRREGYIPAAVYGHNGAESMSLVIKAKDAQTLLKEASLNNTLVSVRVPEQDWKGLTIIREIQSHPWRGDLHHLSFFAIASQDTLQVTVPVHLVGDSPAVKEGGVIEQLINELQVQCAPEEIPESIEIDVSNMEMGTVLHLGEVAVPKGVEILDDLERTVLSIVAPRSVTEEQAETEVAPEVAEALDAMSDEGDEGEPAVQQEP